MRDTLIDSLREPTQSALPICAVVLAFSFILPLTTVALFLTGAVPLAIGLSVPTLGSDTAMVPAGEAIGSELTRSKKIDWVTGGGLLIGVVVTIAEPDLQILTKQVSAAPDDVLVGVVALGAGFFLVLAPLRTVFQINLAHVFIISYVLVFLVAGIFFPGFLVVVFDFGGVTIGPVTASLILALDIGASTTLSGKNSEEDSFGLCALCFIDPIPAVLIMGVFCGSSSSGFVFGSSTESDGLSQTPLLYAVQFVASLTEVVEMLLPTMTIFILLQIFRLRPPHTRLIKIFMGIIYTILDLSIFLAGVNVGFMPVDRLLGGHITKSSHNWVLIFPPTTLGSFIVVAEPVVHILNKQVEDITSGAVSQRAMQIGPSIGISLAVRLSTIRIMYQINIWYFLLPGYAIALLQTCLTSKVFIAIAFDSGGVTASTTAVTSLFPLDAGVCEALGGNIMTGVFGMITIVTTLSLIAIRGVDTPFQYESRQAAALELQVIGDTSDVLIIDTDFDGGETEPQPDGAATGLSEETIPDTRESALPEQNETVVERPELKAVREHGPLLEKDTA